MAVDLVKVKEIDDGMRLNRWFLKYYPNITMGRLQKLLRTKQIKVDGARAEASLKLTTGQVIRIPPLKNDEALPEKSKTPLVSLSIRCTNFGRSSFSKISASSKPST